MGFFSYLEAGLEKYIGVFRQRWGRGKIKPTRIVREMIREMKRQKRQGITRTYVPNHYVVYLSPVEKKFVLSFIPDLESELKDFITQYAEEREYIFPGELKVLIESDEELLPGQFEVEALFATGRDYVVPAEERTVELSEKTILFKRQTTGKSEKAFLEPVRGPIPGKDIVPLINFPLLIGRSETCDLVVRDPGISRRHAILDCRKGKYVLTDLNSTNGTYVNGTRVQRHELQDGDQIKMGDSVFIFKIELK